MSYEIVVPKGNVPNSGKTINRRYTNIYYFEDGGSTYHGRYNTWDFIRGQEYDPWKAMVEPPIELAEFRYIQVWHPRMDSDPAHLWLRRMFAEAAVTD